MTREMFIRSLRELLTPLGEAKCNKFLSYYEELIEDYKESGLTEQEVFEKIGAPQSIADYILSEQENPRKIIMSKSTNKTLVIVLLILGFPLWGSLLFAAALTLLSVYIVIWCVPFTTGVSAVAFFAAALVSIIGSPFMIADSLAVGVVQLGFGVAYFGISILLGLISVGVTKWTAGITKAFTFKIINLFHRKGVESC